MQLLTNMYQDVKNHLNEIPKNTSRQMIFSFGVAFVLYSVVKSNPRVGLIAGALAATATGVHGLISPLFRKFLGHKNLSWGEEMCRTFMAIIPTGYVAEAFGNRSILPGLFVLGLIYGVVNYMDPTRRNTDSANVLPILSL